MSHLLFKFVVKNILVNYSDEFRSRWNNYKHSDRAFLRGEEIKQKFPHEHFLKHDHHSFEKDLTICLIDKTESSDPHKRGYYWMRILKMCSFQI